MKAQSLNRFNHHLKLQVSSFEELHSIVVRLERGEQYRRVVSSHKEFLAEVLQLWADPGTKRVAACSFGDLYDMDLADERPPYTNIFMSRLALLGYREQWRKSSSIATAIFERFPQLRGIESSETYHLKLDRAMRNDPMVISSDKDERLPPEDRRGPKRWRLNLRQVLSCVEVVTEPLAVAIPDDASGTWGEVLPPPTEHITRPAPSAFQDAAINGQEGQSRHAVEAELPTPAYASASGSDGVQPTGTPIVDEMAEMEAECDTSQNEQMHDGGRGQHWNYQLETLSPERLNDVTGNQLSALETTNYGGYFLRPSQHGGHWHVPNVPCSSANHPFEPFELGYYLPAATFGHTFREGLPILTESSLDGALGAPRSSTLLPPPVLPSPDDGPSFPAFHRYPSSHGPCY